MYRSANIPVQEMNIIPPVASSYNFVPQPNPVEIQEKVDEIIQQEDEINAIIEQENKDAPVVQKRALRKCGCVSPFFLILLIFVAIGLTINGSKETCPAVLALNVSIFVVAFLIILKLLQIVYNYIYAKESFNYINFRQNVRRRLRDRLIDYDDGQYPEPIVSPIIGSTIMPYRMTL